MPGLSEASSMSRHASLTVVEALRERYRYPVDAVDIKSAGGGKEACFFRFGSSTCYGAVSHSGKLSANGTSHNRVVEAIVDAGSVCLPFDLTEVAENLRSERYLSALGREQGGVLEAPLLRRGYYAVRRFMPVAFRKHLQRLRLGRWKRIPFPVWPVDCSVDLLFEEVLAATLRARPDAPIPFIWFWPDGRSACMVMTHDVEQAAGRDFCSRLMDLDESAGMRSSFQVVPEERYEVSAKFLEEIRNRGHEVNVHDLNHDGNLFRSREEFGIRAKRINEYARQFEAAGFRSGALYRKLDWFEALDVSYDMSVPNVAHLEAQRGGCCTVMPYFVGHVLELPTTMTQDYALFHLIRNYSLELWEQQIQIILARNGLLNMIVHPDYIREQKALSLYAALLLLLASVRKRHNVWAALPGEVNRWWRQRSQMELIPDGRGWRIVGGGSERAVIAYATLERDRVVYSLLGS
jgi:hypothetical protein